MNPQAADAEWPVYRHLGEIAQSGILNGQGRLDAAAALVSTLRTQPLELKKEMGSLLLLLEAASPYPNLHPAILKLLLLLDPWPVYMEEWPRWEMLLRFAADTAGRLNLPGQRAHFLNNLALLCLQTARPQESEALIQQALIEVNQSPDGVTCARITAAAISVYLTRSELKKAADLLAQLMADIRLQTLSGRQQTEADAYLHMARAQMARRMGDLTQALEAAQLAVRRLEMIPDADPHLLANAYRQLGVYCYAAGLYADGQKPLQQAVRLFKQLGDPYALSLSIGNLGLIYWSLGALDLAEQVIRRSVRLAQQLNVRWHLTSQLGNLGLVSLFQGRLREAERLVAMQLNLAQVIGIETEIARAQGNLGIIKLHRGDYAAAYPLLEADRQSSEQRSKLEGLAVAYANLSRYHQLIGQPKDGEYFARQTLNLGRTLKSRPIEVMALRVLAENAAPSHARRLLIHAYHLGKGRAYDRAACLLGLAAVETDADTSQRLWQRGRSRLIYLGGGAWLRGVPGPVPSLRLPALV